MEFREIINYLREPNTVSALFRLTLATICGGLIGIERIRKRRPAGFRTHTLVCIGAALTMIISQYLWSIGQTTDLSRLGAQVINGIGFLGAGTIIVTGRHQVKGLTTAAGLWAAAIVGLCCGAGFFEGAVLATVIILLAELVFSKLEYFIVSNARVCNLYVEYADSSKLGTIVDTIKKTGAYIVDMEITKKSSAEGRNPCVVFSIRTPRKISHQAIMTMLAKLDGIVSVEEL